MRNLEALSITLESVTQRLNEIDSSNSLTKQWNSLQEKIKGNFFSNTDADPKSSYEDKMLCYTAADSILSLRNRRIKKGPIQSKKESIQRIDLRHRIPFTFPHYDNVQEIEEEVHALPIDDRNQFDRIKLFFSTYFKSLLEPHQLKIVNYLEETISLDEIGLSRENSAFYLRLVKILDLALIWQTRISRTRILYKNSTYDIRTRILELLSPEIETTEAYTFTLDSKKVRNIDYLKNTANWLPERIRFYACSLIPQEYINMIALSKRLNHTSPHVYALRGGTACGKTTLVKQRFPQALDANGELLGSINPDNLKFTLKIKTSSLKILTNMQVHAEVVKGPLSLYKKGVLSSPKYSVILDTRLSSNEDFEAAIEATKIRKGRAIVIDIDSDLYLSMKRVLTTRKATGKSPCVHPQSMIDGFQEIRRCRSGIIKRVEKEDAVDHYELLYWDTNERFHVVAKKNEKIFHIFSPHLLQHCVTPLSYDAIERIKNRSTHVTSWMDIPIGKALEYHALGLCSLDAMRKLEKQRLLLKQFGSTTVYPFTGSWLIDYPHIKDHLDSEHVLHVRGSDENGVGLHWQTNKFAWNLNPNFNPETNRGFQMKVGYFIIPPSSIEMFKAHSLSENIFEELQVRSVTGECIGYRFFVHPEAYTHFQVLHEANIPFIQPDQSEFIGTPTSSYRSWVIRRIIEKDQDIHPCPGTIPFIIKLGVSNFHDSSRLLSRSEVEKSIRAQVNFDNMTINPTLTIFRETCGLVLKEIPNYPPSTSICELERVDSGLVIREFPQALLEGTCKIYSFSALMSVERMKYPRICSLTSSGDTHLPLIYDLIDNAIRNHIVGSSFEFIQRFLIKAVFSALEIPVFEKRLSLALHGQNLCMVLDKKHMPIGIAIRDHGDIHQTKRYVETYTWFYRYHVFIKLLNVMTNIPDYYLPSISGLPIQIGYDRPLKERNLNCYLSDQLTKQGISNIAIMKILKRISITFKEYRKLVKILDKSYLLLLSRHFNSEITDKLLKGESLPSAEIGSSGEQLILKINKEIINSCKLPA